MAMAPEQIGIGIRRHFTQPGEHPYDSVEWEIRDARIPNYKDGTDAFFQPDVEFPVTWSQNATNIVAQKYFRGTLGTDEREHSLKQVIDRVADTITAWGVRDGYFVDDREGAAFRNELKYILLHQRAAFNSPVWFNIGVKDVPQQASACFILAVEDTMDGILNWYREEGVIFKGGSGSGINLSNIRSSYEGLAGGGTASGPVSFMRGADASAGTIKCLHADTPIVTDRGVLPIRDVRAGDAVATRFGRQPVEAVHDNGVRRLVRVRTSLGDEIVCTPEHRFLVRGSGGVEWREAGDLQDDDYLTVDLSSEDLGQHQQLQKPARGHHREIEYDLPDVLDEALALWLGWIYGDGSITTHQTTNVIALQVGDADPELPDRYASLTQAVFGGHRTHLCIDRHLDRPDASASMRLASTQIIRFLELNGLRKGRAAELRVPRLVESSPAAVRASFLAGLFEADGHVGNGYPQLSTVSQGLASDVHRLLLSIGIPSTIGRIDDRRAAFGSSPVHVVRVVGGEGVRRFAKLVGFISERKQHALEAAVVRKSSSPFETQWVLPHVVDELDAVWQATADAKLRRALSPYCRLDQPRALSLLRARELVERFPVLASTALGDFIGGDAIYVQAGVVQTGDGPTFDLTVNGVHEYLVNSVVTHNSGGKTRRAAKMVILDVDHPDIEEFIWCKAREERKARALAQAGFDMDLDGRDYHSIQYQNANNSVRVSDEFMEAVEADADWDLKAVKTGAPIKTVKARELMRQIMEASWECADPGMQFDTTINRWHTASNTGRINGSNPCCFTGETLVETSDGPVAFEMLEKRWQAGETLPTIVSFDHVTRTVVERAAARVWVSGRTWELVEVCTDAGHAFRCTPEHRFLTLHDGYVEARNLTPGTRLQSVADASDQILSVAPVLLDSAEPVYDLEIDETHNFAITSDGPTSRGSVIVHNSEYMHLDNSACNLASINLLKYLGDDGTFDVEGYRHTVEVVFTAQEILVGNADYPTEKIAENSRRFRQLGLGYANLGALLMAQGLPYDSDGGRAWAAALTALMTGHAYATSARTAGRMGPFAGYDENAEPMLNVLRMHRDAAAQIDEELVPPDLLSAAQRSWDEAVEVGEIHGVRNSQASVLAPTGCLVGGTLVATERGLVRLGTLGDPTGEQWQTLDVDVQTDDGPQRATQFYVNGVEPVVEVETTRGYRIQGTAKHRVKIVNEAGEWVWRRFSDVAPGDRVPLSLDQLIGDAQIVGLPPLPEAHWAGEHHARAPRTMTPALAELLGYFMGDGSLHSKGIRLCVAEDDIDVIDRLSVLGKECFGLEAHVTPKQGHAEVAFHSVRLTQWWEACGFAKHAPSEGHRGKGWTPHIPNAVLHSNDRSTYAAFVRGLFEADGTVTVGIPSWSTTSLEFSHDVQSLLLALGYPTTRKLDVTGWGNSTVAVLRLLNSSFHTAWLDDIGFMSGRKAARVTQSEGRQTARQDHIPVSRELIDRLAPENDRLRRVLLMEVGRGRVSRRIATELFERTEDPELGHLLGFFYDTVATAEVGDEELTYDLSVPENVTYIANGFVSHNTIGLMMDCDTTGIEPDLALTKAKKLVGGGTMLIVNQTVPRALTKLGYSDDQRDAIVKFIDDEKTIVGAPVLETEHLPVFACSMGDNTIHYMGHVKMMGAVQPFLSGAISKTCNVPEETSVEELEALHLQAWKLGLKAVAIYRDNCKVAQPLATQTKDGESTDDAADTAAGDALTQQVERIVETVIVQEPIRQKLPRTRTSKTFSFRVADCHGYATVGEFEDGRPGEVFLKVAKQGSTLSGIMDAFAISVSLGLQYGVPLRAFVEKFTNMRFEPAGMTDDPDIRFATSLVDYIFRRLAVEYMDYAERDELGIFTVDERMQPTLPGVEEATTPSHPSRDLLPPEDRAPSDAIVVPEPELPPAAPQAPASSEAEVVLCYVCGDIMQRAGSCHACPSCGATSGCS